MYKNKFENVEVYFICNKEEEMDLVEGFYDEVLDIHNWYINAYLAYNHWKTNFKELSLGKLAIGFLMVAASRYLIYTLEHDNYKNAQERAKLLKDLTKIEKKLKSIIKENSIFENL